jgi:hypothetical protein
MAQVIEHLPRKQEAKFKPQYCQKKKEYSESDTTYTS